MMSSSLIDKKGKAYVKPRKYWCKGCRQLFNPSIVPIGKVTKMANGDAVYLCTKCAGRDER